MEIMLINRMLFKQRQRTFHMDRSNEWHEAKLQMFKDMQHIKYPFLDFGLMILDTASESHVADPLFWNSAQIMMIKNIMMTVESMNMNDLMLATIALR